MIGSIIGDIVGSRFEFSNHLSTRFELFAADSRFTDDSVCAFAVADWLLSNAPGVPALDFAPILHRWCNNYPMGDYGCRFQFWIQNPVPYNSFGNGAAMRIAPVGFFALSESVLFRLVYRATSVSHNHPEGVKGAEAVAFAIHWARMGKSKEFIRGAIASRFGYSFDQTCDEIRPFNSFDETCQVTVPQAFQCFFESTDFESCIRLAVSIGGDSDTIACIAGGIAEAFYGVPPALESNALSYLSPEMKTVYQKFKSFTS